MAEEEAREGPALVLPVLGHGSEADILREHDASEASRTLQELVVGERGAAVLDRRQDVHPGRRN